MSARSLGVGTAIAALVYAKTLDRRVLKALLGGLASAALDALSQLFSRALIGLEPEPWPLNAWAEQYDEAAYDPDIAVLDCHHHLWDPRVHDKGWPMSKFMIKVFFSYKPEIVVKLFCSDPKNAILVNCLGKRAPLMVPYMAESLIRDINSRQGGHKVVGTVYIECGWKTPGVEEVMWPVKEADMATEVHKSWPKLCNGIVAHADLRLGAGVEPALKYYKQNPLVKGIRAALAWTDDDTILSAHTCDKNTAYDPKFREGFALLQKYGFSYDCWLYHENIAGLTDLAKAFPDTTIICDHMGFPLGLGKYDRKDTFPEWKGLVKALAAQTNVFMKIGGFGMRGPGFGFDERPKPPTSDELAEAWGPYVLYCLETFGVDRCLMESNFPMDKVSCSYTVLFNALKKIVKSYPKEDKRKLFEINAKRVYRITDI